MKAVVVTGAGGPEVVSLVHDHPTPKRGPGQVLIRAVSAGVNPVDLAVRDGAYARPKNYPKVLGGDVAGLVEDVDEGSKFKKGDKVWALTPGFMTDDNGCYAEYVVADEGWVARVPDSLPLERAGAVPLVALTAWQALQQARPRAGQRVLVTAASGGVGHMAVQIAKALGLHVVALAGPKNVDWVRALGADEGVDYTSQDVVQLYKDAPFDISFDVMGTRSDLLRKLLSVTKSSGHLAHVLNPYTDQALLEEARAAHEAGKGPALGTTLVQPSGDELQKIADLFAAGKLRVEVALSVPLEEVQRAHKQVATGHTRGKVVLTI